jgi:hypothetical protein
MMLIILSVLIEEVLLTVTMMRRPQLQTDGKLYFAKEHCLVWSKQRQRWHAHLSTSPKPGGSAGHRFHGERKKQPLLPMPRISATMMTRIGVTIAVGSSIWKDCRKPKKA